MSQVTLTAIAAMALALASESALAADTLIDTYGTDGRVSESKWALYDLSPSFGDAQSLAVKFSVLAATRLTGVQTSIEGTGSFELRIVADNNGSPTGTAAYSTTLVNPLANSAISGLSIDIRRGTYWLAAFAEPSAEGTWVGGGADAIQPWAVALNSSNDGWLGAGPLDAPAARLFISAVPEPSGWALLLGGAMLLQILRRRRTMD